MEVALYLIPVTLGDTAIEKVLPAYNKEIILGIKHFIVEDVRSARRFLKKVEKKIKKEAKEKEENNPASKKIDLTKVSNIIMELAKKPTKGKDIDKIKIPNYIKDMVPNFFEVMEEAK